MATQKGRNWSSGDIVTAANLSSIERGVSAVAEEYTPTTWANGNTVTAAGLNNIEQGIANAGGGSSDFSTATMIVTNSSGTAFEGAGSNFDDVDNTAYGDFYLEGNGVIDLILYKDSSRITLFTAIYKNTVALSGDVEGIEDITDTNKYEAFMVTGDCTITISSGGSLPK